MMCSGKVTIKGPDGIYTNSQAKAHATGPFTIDLTDTANQHGDWTITFDASVTYVENGIVKTFVAPADVYTVNVP